ncbi:MAG: MFS transporter, partial [Candidatus Lokiarchaeota archaeon]|nr:MFS transporter [Candidatus Lokiarchaeota archaeon]
LRILTVIFIVFLAIFNYTNRAILVPNSKFILMDLIGMSVGEAESKSRLITNLHTIFKLSAAAFTIFYGYLNDKYPRKWILALGGIGYSLGSIGTYFVGTYNGLIGLQIITAICIGASLPTSYSILSDMYPVANRSKVFGIFGLSTIFGDILGNLMVTLLFPADITNLSAWRLPFLICGMLSLMLAILILLTAKEPKRGQMEENLKQVLSEESIEYSYRIQIDDLKQVWKNKSNRWLILNFVDNMSGGYILATAVDWLRTERNASPDVAGYLVLIPAIGIMLGTVFWGYMGDKLYQKDKRGRVGVCIICMIMSAILLPLAVTRPFDLNGMDFGQVLSDTAFWIAFAIFFVFFFFNNGIGPNWHSTLIDANPVEIRGSMISVATFFEEVGEALGIVIGGIIHDLLIINGSSSAFETTYAILTVFMALGIFMWIPLFKNIKKDIKHVKELNKKRAQELKSGEKP